MASFESKLQSSESEKQKKTKTWFNRFQKLIFIRILSLRNSIYSSNLRLYGSFETGTYSVIESRYNSKWKNT